METKDRRSVPQNANGTRRPAARPAGTHRPAARPEGARRPAASASARPQPGRTRPGTQSGNRGVQTGRTASRPAGTNRRSTVNSNVRYTDPKAFNGKKLLLQLATLVAVVLAVLFGMSIFFKVDLEKATVAGNAKYTVNEVIEASGLRGGSNLLTLSDAQLTGNIKAKLPYVSSARVGIKLPDTVNIEIKELDVPYSVEATDGSWWLMGSDGRIVDTISMSEAKTYTQILGVKILEPAVGGNAVAQDPKQEEEIVETTEAKPDDVKESQPVESIPQESTAAPQMEPVLMTGAEQMQVVLSVLTNLEANGILGEIATLDVTDTNEMEMWYGSRYQVNLGNAKNLSYKISMLKAAVDQMGKHQSGQLDVSFTTWPNQVGYTPFA